MGWVRAPGWEGWQERGRGRASRTQEAEPGQALPEFYTINWGETKSISQQQLDVDNDQESKIIANGKIICSFHIYLNTGPPQAQHDDHKKGLGTAKDSVPGEIADPLSFKWTRQ
jgi:hypothetical protein